MKQLYRHVLIAGAICGALVGSLFTYHDSNFHRYNLMLLSNLLSGAFVGVLAAALFGIATGTRHRKWNFSLKTLLLILAISAVICYGTVSMLLLFRMRAYD
jgi:hypothetical protein